MRKYYLYWGLAVFGIVGTAYGSYSIVYNNRHGKDMPIYGLVLLIFGILSLMAFLAWALSIHLSKQKKRKNSATPCPIEDKEVKIEEKTVPEEKEAAAAPKPEPERPKEEAERRYTSRSERLYVSSSRPSFSTAYVKQVGYGPVLRIEGPRIIDMRSNTYYRIDDNFVMQDGYGTRYEIRGNQIKDAFGGYLFEVSGSNINKVFGGFYASISWNYITLYDLSEKYEMTDSLSKKQILVAAALLFGNR